MQRRACNRFDAIVIGGGPAGSLAARGLAIQGWRTILIERGQRNRTKTCGHCLNPRGLRMLEECGLLPAVRAIAVGSTGHLRVHGHSGLPLTMPLSTNTDGSSPERGLLTPRNALDQVLLDAAQAAGVEVFQPASARIHRGTDGSLTVTVRSSDFTGDISAPLIVGADGLGSSVARSAGMCRNGVVGRKFGFSFDSTNRFSFQWPAESEAIDMIVSPDGYLGVVRHADGTRHCAGLVSSTGPASAREPLAFARRSIKTIHAEHLGPMEGNDIEPVSHFAATGPMPWRPREIANEHVALVGDAAGYIEPFTGEGMGWAMQSASLLLNTLADREPGSWNRSLANTYERHWRKHIGRAQCACRAIAYALASPAIRGATMKIARRCPAISRHLIKWVHS